MKERHIGSGLGAVRPSVFYLRSADDESRITTKQELGSKNNGELHAPTIPLSITNGRNVVIMQRDPSLKRGGFVR